MWYRKALDLNELNKEYSEEHNKAINKYEDILENITIEDIFRAMDAGEEWSSDSGAIKICVDDILLATQPTKEQDKWLLKNPVKRYHVNNIVFKSYIDKEMHTIGLSLLKGSA